MALSGLRDYGLQLAGLANPNVFQTDYTRACNCNMALGVARAAYKAIKNGRDVLTVVEELYEEAEFYGVPTQKLDVLIAKLTMIMEW